MLEIGDYKLNILDNETAEIVKYLGTEPQVSVPSKIQDYNITAIRGMTFYGYENLISIIVPDSINSIDYLAFYKCKNLESIIVSPDNNYYASIDGVLFNKENKSLVIFPQGKKISEYTIPNGIESIESNAFQECDNLIKITLPNGLKKIGVAFQAAHNLKTVILPDTLSELELNPFLNCNNLENIIISPDNQTFAVIDNVLFNKETKSLIAFPAGKKISEYIVPQGIKSINKLAFSECDNLKKVLLPEGVSSIGDYSFFQCSNLTVITLPETLVSIGKSAFYNCKNLNLIALPDKLSIIGEDAFAMCVHLSKIVLPDSLSMIGKDAFALCGLTSVTMPDSVFDVINVDEVFRGINLKNITWTVERDSKAREWAIDNGFPYTYSDSNDWLN